MGVINNPPASSGPVEIVEKLVRHAEYLRQINSNRAFSFLWRSRVVSVVTVALSSIVTFVAFYGPDRIHSQIASIAALPTGEIELGLNLLILLLVLATICSLIFQFAEHAVEHHEAIRRITEFIGPHDDMCKAARAGLRKLTIEDAQAVRQRYLLMVAPLPASTDRQFYRAKRDYRRKQSLTLDPNAHLESPGQRLERAIRSNSTVMRLLQLIQEHGNAELWLCGGVIRNLIWDDRLNQKPTKPDDIDVIFFDMANKSRKLEADIKQQLNATSSGVVWDVRNQARPDSQGRTPNSLREAVSQFPETCSAVAVRLVGNTLEVVCPWGLDDLVDMTIRPTSPIVDRQMRDRVASKQWLEKWPGTTLVDD